MQLGDGLFNGRLHHRALFEFALLLETSFSTQMKSPNASRGCCPYRRILVAERPQSGCNASLDLQPPSANAACVRTRKSSPFSSERMSPFVSEPAVNAGTTVSVTEEASATAWSRRSITIDSNTLRFDNG